jgi:hypothetical protein
MIVAFRVSIDVGQRFLNDPKERRLGACGASCSRAVSRGVSCLVFVSMRAPVA